MPAAADPAGVFESDVQRHVLGHLSHPDDEYGWTAEALGHRVVGDHVLTGVDLGQVLAELSAAGYTEQSGDAWRMSPAGFAAITGPALNQGTDGPALIESHPSHVGAATAWGV